MARSGLQRLFLLSLLAGLVAAPSARAETAWVKDEVRLNLRTGPGTQYRIKGGIGTGDQLQVLQRGDGWTHVRSTEHGEGWIPEGFLQSEPPAAVRLARSEAQTAEFRSQFDGLSNRVSELEAENASLAERDAQQKTQLEQVTRENVELRAGARWPHWITGAGILTAGMLMGAILHAISGRRQRPRIRL
jgi:SH3 domain protein